MDFRKEIEKFLQKPGVEADSTHEGLYHLSIGIFQLTIDDQEKIVALRDTEDQLTLYHKTAEEDYEFLLLINEALKVTKKFSEVQS